MTWGLLLTSFGLGLRHGVDWDHIAAIADLSGTASDRRRGFFLSFLYAAGHAVVVFALGALAIAFGATIPESVESWMGRLVGVTLLALGFWVLIELARHGRDFRLRSRWMLVLDGTFAGMRRVRDGRAGRQISVEHDHGHEHDALDDQHETPHAHDHAHIDADVAIDAEINLVDAEPVSVGAGSRWNRLRARGHHGPAGHSHSHTHALALPDQANGYGNGTAAGIGMLHGIGIESPTQIAVFVASTAVVGASTGFVLLAAWVIGLIVANSVLAVLAGFGILQAERNFAIYATIAVIVALGSIAMGVLFIAGWEILPEIDLGT